ncbi:MAG: pyrimidine dimer DNA glycosylase/endonuclease V [Rhodanobacteraceae bacterium]
MRLWTLHPRYLDAKGLVALWREALLAQKVLRGETRGYRHHPQLLRFAQQASPLAAIASYLAVVHAESLRRCYAFDAGKIGTERLNMQLDEHQGQLLHEWQHLLCKLARRDPARHALLHDTASPMPHPLFRIVAGNVREWEKSRPRRSLADRGVTEPLILRDSVHGSIPHHQRNQ